MRSMSGGQRVLVTPKHGSTKSGQADAAPAASPRGAVL
jgi:hypothetical protein